MNFEMKLSTLILYTSIFVWLLPPLKQFRGRFFYYFIIEAIADPIAYTLLKLHCHNVPFYSIKELLIIAVLWRPKWLPKKIPYFILPMIALYYAVDKVHYSISYYFIALEHMAILFFIFRLAANDAIDLKKIKIFYILIIFYELSVVLKYIFVAAMVDLGIVYFYLTTAFEILLGLSFVFVAEDDAELAIALK
jgi:hypothetical protein